MTGRAVAAACLFAAACGAGDREVTLTILGTTDVHGHLVPYDYALDAPADHSLAQVATLVDSIRSARPNVVLVDSGDLLQGTPLDEFQARVEMDDVHPVIAAMNRLDYDASAVGNHEFNYGIPYLERALAGAEVPFLAANIYVEETGELLLPPFRIVERSGVRVGILGFTTPGVSIWDRADVEGRLRFEDIVESGRRWLPALLDEEPDVVVAIAHSGVGPGSSYDDATGVPEENAVARLAVEVPGIDVIFAGHTREPIAGRRIGGALVLHAGAHADHLAVAELTVIRTPEGAEVQSEGRLLPTAGIPADPDLVALVTPAHERAIAWLGEPIGYTPDTWSAATSRIEDTPIADLIQRVQLDLTGADVSAAAIFRTAAGFGPGPITRRDILGLYVYPNALRAVRISGADLRDYLEQSAGYYRTQPSESPVNPTIPGYNFDMLDGVTYALDLTRPVGDRVVSLTRDGREIVETDSLTLALNDYRQGGGGGFESVRGAPVVYRDEVDVASRIIEYVIARDTLRVRDVFRPNWELRPPAAVERLLAGQTASSDR
ncbi:MAG: 5'-nucleotidase C-terminal domain-containing protein [Gemmatimonadota bacterium]|nr:5'-nucleotidase C-terminal domain-containing protein [Gemmatimonadota bacterium]